MLFLQEIRNLLAAAVVFAFADGPDKLFGGKGHLAGGAGLLFGFLMLLQEGQQAMLCDGFEPQADGASIFAQTFGNAGFGQSLPVQLPGQGDQRRCFHLSSMPLYSASLQFFFAVIEIHFERKACSIGSLIAAQQCAAPDAKKPRLFLFQHFPT